MDWYVYIVYCSDSSLYTGISNDVDRRIEQHASGNGAKYFRGRKPLQLVYLESGHSRSTAGQREAEIKRLPKSEKLQLIRSEINEVAGAVNIP